MSSLTKRPKCNGICVMAGELIEGMSMVDAAMIHPECELHNGGPARIITAPNYESESSINESIFLAGGITGCPDWQTDMIDLLEWEEITIYNPRRINFPIDDPSAARQQILWEDHHLRKADKILFWFPKETLCPIALYELGKYTEKGKPIAIGIHPEYERRLDIEIQTELSYKSIDIVYSLEELADLIIWMA